MSESLNSLTSKIYEDCLSSKSKDISFLNHEINTPLTLIINRIELLLDKAEAHQIDSKKLINELQKVLSSTQKIQTIFQAERENLNPPPFETNTNCHGNIDLPKIENFNFSAEFQSAISKLKNRYEKKGLTLEINFDPNIESNSSLGNERNLFHALKEYFDFILSKKQLLKLPQTTLQINLSRDFLPDNFKLEKSLATDWDSSPGDLNSFYKINFNLNYFEDKQQLISIQMLSEPILFKILYHFRAFQGHLSLPKELAPFFQKADFPQIYFFDNDSDKGHDSNALLMSWIIPILPT